MAMLAALVATTPVAAAPPGTELPVPGRPVVAIRSISTAQHGLDSPAAVTYRTDTDALVVSGDGRYLELNATDDLYRQATLPPGVDPATLTFDSTASAVAAIDDTGVVHLSQGPAAFTLEATPVLTVPFAAAGAASYDTEGTLYVIDRPGEVLTAIEPDGTRSDIELGGALPGSAAGLAHHPVDNQLYLSSTDGRTMIRLTTAGVVTARYDLSQVGLITPGGMALGPSSDATDAADDLSLYIADGSGVIVETSPDPAVADAGFAAEAVIGSSLIRTYDLSAESPPSPDTAGVTWLPDRGLLMASDSEVNEMPIYAGRNLFAITPSSGSVGNQGVTTVGFSNEPTGLGYNPADQHLFVSDDDANEIFEVNAGPDGRYGNGDDSVTHFDTANLGSQDSEDVAYGQNTLYVIDGVNREVYVIEPGPNGMFDGIPGSGGDDVFTQFDVQVFGAGDPEGITYRPSTGTLLVVDHKTDLVFELTTSGNLINTIDITAANSIVAAGIEVAPASDGTGAEHLYIVDRGIDNDTDSDENDGRMYEMDGLDPGGNLPPTVQAGLDQTINAPSLPASTTVSGSVIDDGKPDPPGVTTVAWSLVSGPAPVSFTAPTATTTDVQFTEAGTYVLRLTGDDSDVTGSDDLEITIIGPGGPFVFDAGIPTGGDDVEETAAGNVTTTSSDLEMVLDGTDQQTVGMRWTGVDIPAGAIIEEAYIQFRADEVTTAPTSLTLHGHRIANAPPFAQTNGNVSTRPATAAAVPWTPPAWPTINVAGPAQRTPDLSAIVQELVLLPSWSPGNAMAMVVTGTGKRTADSSEGGFAPMLHVSYSIDDNAAPVVDAGPDQNVNTATVPHSLDMAGNASDDGLPNPPATLTTTWTQIAGPASATITNPSSPTTNVTFPTHGQYTLRLTGDDSARTTTDDVIVTITEPVLVLPGGFGTGEGDSGSQVFEIPITLSAPSDEVITVDYMSWPCDIVEGFPCGDGLATQGVDYDDPGAGTLTFQPGETTKTVPVTVYGDTDIEPRIWWGEWFFVKFLNPSSNAVLDNSFFGLGVGIIGNDDG